MKTVSRVVNGEPGVSPQMAERVRRAIAELGFMPNDIARNLVLGGRSRTIGLLIKDLANPFYSVMAQAAEKVARERGWLLILASSEGDPATERRLVSTLLGRRVDGLLVVPADSDYSHLSAAAGIRPPAVFLGRLPEGVEGDAVLLDDRIGARQGVAHLIGLGHRRIGYVGAAQQRELGYAEALAEAGMAVDPALVAAGCREPEEAKAVVHRFLAAPDPPTAIFAGNNRVAVGVYLALRDLSTRVDLVGFDDFDLAEQLQITVVAHDPAAMGRGAAELLFARLEGDLRPPQRLILPTHLIVRGTGLESH